MATKKGKKKPIWVSIEAHEALRKVCEQTGRTQQDVLSELLYNHVKPQLESPEAGES